MNSKNILAISSSRVGNSGYLEKALPMINEFLGEGKYNIAFLPFASVDGHDEYLQKVKEGLNDLNYNIQVVEGDKAKTIIEESNVVMVGGGNTFKLLHDIYYHDLLELIQHKVAGGTPYIGWSAGANITGKTIGTTNDMPIIEPKSFKAFGFFPFQINPHYINVKPEGHNGETRDQRLEEFIKVNTGSRIVGLPEGTALHMQNGKLHLIGAFDGILYETEKETDAPVKREIKTGTDLSFLL